MTLLFGGIDDEPGIIVGVMDNYNIHPLSQAIEPTVLGYSEPFMQSLGIKISTRENAAFDRQTGTGMESPVPSMYPSTFSS